MNRISLEIHLSYNLSLLKLNGILVQSEKESLCIEMRFPDMNSSQPENVVTLVHLKQLLRNLDLCRRNVICYNLDHTERNVVTWIPEIESLKILSPLDTGRNLNVHKTFRRRPGRLLNVLCSFNLRSVSRGSFQKWYQPLAYCQCS